MKEVSADGVPASKKVAPETNTPKSPEKPAAVLGRKSLTSCIPLSACLYLLHICMYMYISTYLPACMVVQVYLFEHMYCVRTTYLRIPE